MATYYRQYTVTASAVQLSSLTFSNAAGVSVSLTDNHVLNIDFLGKSTNTGHIYLGGSNVTNAPANAGVDIAPGNGYSTGPLVQRATGLNEIYIVGTASDILFIEVSQ